MGVPVSQGLCPTAYSVFMRWLGGHHGEHKWHDLRGVGPNSVVDEAGVHDTARGLGDPIRVIPSTRPTQNRGTEGMSPAEAR